MYFVSVLPKWVASAAKVAVAEQPFATVTL